MLIGNFICLQNPIKHALNFHETYFNFDRSLDSLLSRLPRPDSSCDVLLCAYTIEEVQKTSHLDCYYAHVKHEREDSAPII